ncbi:unnamed protein product [Gongylonema pulchrum]|uniref:Peptidase_M13_N domain-containing protein n=1 Tax=Gongylonema pulchrum TaxID=637853 RepID=A0A183EWE9_9BILA|nr:unnamed protein product [Gongylonema pulchrum]
MAPFWMTCQARASNQMTEVINQIYISTFFNRSSKPFLAQMVRNIKEAFAEMIRSEEWMDEPTKKLALQKVETHF